MGHQRCTAQTCSAILVVTLVLGLAGTALSKKELCTITSLADISAAASGAPCPSKESVDECSHYTYVVMDNLYNLCNELNWVMIRVPHTISQPDPQYTVFYSCSGCPNVWAVYGIAPGTRFCLRNDGARGYDHWHAFGTQTQDNNYFLYYGANRGDCDRGRKVNIAEIKDVDAVMSSVYEQTPSYNLTDFTAIDSYNGGEPAIVPVKTPQECAHADLGRPDAETTLDDSVSNALRILRLPNKYSQLRRALGPQYMAYVERQICQLGKDNGLVAARRYIEPLLHRYAAEKVPDAESQLPSKEWIELAGAIVTGIIRILIALAFL
jgi:hypothetical protein